jgi:hypothetical protein
VVSFDHYVVAARPELGLPLGCPVRSCAWHGTTQQPFFLSGKIETVSNCCLPCHPHIGLYLEYRKPKGKDDSLSERKTGTSGGEILQVGLATKRRAPALENRELGRPAYGVENLYACLELLIPQTPLPLPTLIETSTPGT